MTLAWNTDFSTLNDTPMGEVLADPGVVQMFADALNERRAANGLYLPLVEHNGANPFTFSYGKGTQSPVFWSTFFVFAQQMCGSYVNGSPSRFIHSLTQTLNYPSGVALPVFMDDEFRDQSGSSVAVPQPPPAGAIREFPREIWRIDYPGVEGQIARFVYRNQGKWYQDQVTGPEFNQTCVTPSDQAKNSIQFFKYVSGAWTALAGGDLLNQADRVSATVDWSTIWSGVGMAHGWELPGDYATGHLLNMLRDVLNLQVTSAMGLISNRGILNLGASQAPSPNNYFYAASLPQTAIFSFLDSDGVSRGNFWVRPSIDGSVPNVGGKMPNPLGLSRKIELWRHDNADTSAAWTMVQDFGTTADETFFEFQIPSGDATYSPYIGSGFQIHEAFTGPCFAFLQHWDVGGGFQYTAST